MLNSFPIRPSRSPMLMSSTFMVASPGAFQISSVILLREKNPNAVMYQEKSLFEGHRHVVVDYAETPPSRALW